ncbi:hypothetical protein [Chryseobacterium sp. LC2016-27]|nr:hypothetical protein [Chryseobacterium sp. LC2016-27]
MLVTYEDVNSTYLKTTSIYGKYNYNKEINNEVLNQLINPTFF